MRKIVIINGVNLILTGKREPSMYGNESLDDINLYVSNQVSNLDVELDFFCSNHEGEIIDKLHSSSELDGVVLNAGAHSHYSYAIRDAIEGIKAPVVEVHMSNIFARETFRRISVISDVCKGCICGFGKQGYVLAVLALLKD